MFRHQQQPFLASPTYRQPLLARYLLKHARLFMTMKVLYSAPCICSAQLRACSAGAIIYLVYCFMRTGKEWRSRL